MPDQEVGFRIVLRHRYEEGERGAWDSDGARREKFWNAVMRDAEPYGHEERSLDRDRSPEALERRFLHALPTALREAFYGIYPVVARDEFDRTERTGRTPLVVFEVLSHRYGSLDVLVGLEPVGKLVEAFDRNFDYFRVALQDFVPAAVNRALIQAVQGHYGGYPPWEGLDISVEPTPTLQAAFISAASVPPTAPPSGWGAAAKANWIWIAANTSLLVPTALAALYLFVIREDVREGERTRSTNMQGVVAEQTKLLNTCGALLKEALPYRPTPPDGKPAQTGGKAGVLVP